MKQAILMAACLALLASPILAQQPACDRPSILRITMKGPDAYYQLDNHLQHKRFILGEVADAVRSCSPDKMIFVVTDYNVPLRLVQLPGKEQITQLRYFVQGPDGVAHELLFGPSYQELPLSPEIIALPEGKDLPPTSANSHTKR
jgi:hypothetical protein